MNLSGLFLALLAPFGLGLYRSGLSHRKTFTQALLKPFFNLIFGSIAFWVLGSGFASNSNNHGIGTENFFLSQNASSKEFYQVNQTNFKVFYL